MDPRTMLQSGPAPCPPPSGMPAMPVAIIGTDGLQPASIPVMLNESMALNILRDRLDTLASLLSDLSLQSHNRDALLADPFQSTSNETALATIVTTTAIKIASANTARKSIIISNHGTGDLYFKASNAVASSGINSGVIVPSKGVYTDSGYGLYLGEIWGIYSVASSTYNVVTLDRA